jgi:hypothetical protein
LFFGLEPKLRLESADVMGSGSGAISSEGVNDFHFFGSPHKLLSRALALLSCRLAVQSSEAVRCNSGSQNWCTFRSAYIAMADRGCIDTAHVSAPAAMVFQRCCSDIVVRAVYEPAQYSKTGCFPIAAPAPSSCKAVWIIRNSLRPKPNCQSRCSAPPRDSTNALAGLSC